jgi:hypothetical protein
MKAARAITGAIVLTSLAFGGTCRAESAADYLSTKVAAVGLNHLSSPFPNDSNGGPRRNVNLVSCSSGEHKCAVGATQWCCPANTPCENNDGTPHDGCHD